MNRAATPAEARIARSARAAMLYDASRMDQPDEACFRREHWRAAGSIEEAAGGRGTVAFLRRGDARWVLRHYRRGGWVARWLDDEYFWTGEERTRSFAEFRLLQQLAAWDLPVPRPVAARYERAGLVYRADLLTEELPIRRTLAQALQAAPVGQARWAAVGECVRRLHERGVHHADLNANNLLLGEAGEVYVIDFDRGRIEARGSWEQGVLARLQRSLRKVTANLPADRFGEVQWRWLLAGAAA
jgi:3-deoxy-D-manno-octulosonic acid kinase